MQCSSLLVPTTSPKPNEALHTQLCLAGAEVYLMPRLSVVTAVQAHLPIGSTSAALVLEANALSGLHKPASLSH